MLYAKVYQVDMLLTYVGMHGLGLCLVTGRWRKVARRRAYGAAQIADKMQFGKNGSWPAGRW